MVPQSKISFTRQATGFNWNHSPRRQGIPKTNYFGTQKPSKIPSLNKRPLVPKVMPMGAPAEPKIRQKIKRIVSESPLKSDAGKNRVSDRLKHRKHSSRASGATVSARAETHRKVSKTMPEGIQKRHRTVKKHSRNVSEITWQNHASENRKLLPKEPRGTQKSSKNKP